MTNVVAKAVRRLLVLSPHFPPVNTPDMQRVRMSLPYFREFGWEPVVLAVDPAYVEGVVEPDLLETVPPDVGVHRVRALSAEWTRRMGVGAVGLRAFPFLYGEGIRMIRRYQPDLVYISTTAFQAMALGRMWKERTGVPFVLDIQDPWVPERHQVHGSRRGLKHRLAARLHKMLEPWTMRGVDGLVAVSENYHEVLRRRYPWIARDRCLTLPFGADARDHEIAGRKRFANKFFHSGDGGVHGLYAGAISPSMAFLCEAICLALQKGTVLHGHLYGNIRMHFIGTSYAPGDSARPTIQPFAEELGLDSRVHEHPQRVPYFTALRLQQEADFLLVPGSADPAYTASKIYPLILARRPLLAVFHEDSSVVPVLRSSGAGHVVTFRTGEDTRVLSERLLAAWTPLLERLPFTPDVDWNALEGHSARQMTRRQCAFFERIVSESSHSGRARLTTATSE